MPIETVLISGPPGGGKTTVARLIAEKVLDYPAHYLRLVPAPDHHTNVILRDDQIADGEVAEGGIAGSGFRSAALGNGWASVHTVQYTPERLFETVPDGLRAARAIDRRAVVIIEGSDDPALRHAFPYEYRVFVMPTPATGETVFRTAEAAAVALQQVLQDTASFASEIFGLFDAAELDDSVDVRHTKPVRYPGRGPAVEQLDVGESQLHHFLSSPLGAEIGSRIQLQPEYHALVEADIVVINTILSDSGPMLDGCVKRLEKLLSRVRQDTRRHSVLYWGDILDHHDPTHPKLLRRLRTLLVGEP